MGSSKHDACVCGRPKKVTSALCQPCRFDALRREAIEGARARMMNRVHHDLTTGCWVWTGARSRRGYAWVGSAPPRRGPMSGHQLMWEVMRGPIPPGLQLDHLCRNRACINPDHLEPVTSRVNMRRGRSPTMLIHMTGKCARGHDRATFGYARKDRPGGYNCRACRNEDRKQRRVADPEWAEYERARKRRLYVGRGPSPRDS